MPVNTELLKELQGGEEDDQQGFGGKTKFIVAALCIVALSVYVFSGFFLKGRTEQPPLNIVDVLKYEQSVGVTPLEQVLLRASGRVQSYRSVVVTANLPGRLSKVLVSEGEQVAEGQILAHMDTRLQKISVKAAAAQLSKAISLVEEQSILLAQLKNDYRRTLDLKTKKVVSEVSLEIAKADMDKAKARLKTLNHDVEVAQNEHERVITELDELNVRAPFTGVVTSIHSQVGAIVIPYEAGAGYGQSGILNLVDLDDLYVELDINEKMISNVFEGQSVKVKVNSVSDETVNSRVLEIIPVVDAGKGTVKVQVAYADKAKGETYLGMSVDVEFLNQEFSMSGSEQVASSSGGFNVPQSALGRNGGLNQVYILDGDTVAVRNVVIGAKEPTLVAITSGLTYGDLIVVDAIIGRELLGKQAIKGNVVNL